MSLQAPRAVFDCNIFFQALISPTGPAARCLIAASRAETLLFCSEVIIEEFRSVASRPGLRARFGITDERVLLLIDVVRATSVFVENAPAIFECPRDPDDAHYINLALATGAAYVVTRDNDLLVLNGPSTPEGRAFLARFPGLEILEPVAFLDRLRTPRA